MKILDKILFIKYFQLYIFFFSYISSAQVGIGTNNPSSASLLELKSNSKGLLLPRVSLISTNDITTVPNPVTSLLVYNLSTVNDVSPGFYYWDSLWKPLKTSLTPSSWDLGGNIVSSSDFFGSINYNPLIFKVNNIPFGKFHPNGGITIGIGANSNDNNSIAIGASANSFTSVQAIALGASTTASGYQSTAVGYQTMASNNSSLSVGKQCTASGYQSTAIGINVNSSNNNSLSIGTSSIATGQQSIAIGNQAAASGQNATAIGNMAVATQDNSLILGDSSNANTKIGIGTNTPDERLHIIGSLKLVDGTQGNGYVLTSDSSGKARWQNQNSLKSFGSIYYSGSGQTVNQLNNITFGNTNSSNGVTIDSDGITVNNNGIYKITYQIGISKTSGNNSSISFNLYKNYNLTIPGSLSITTIGNNQSVTINSTVIISLNAYDKISIRSNITENNVQYVPSGVSLSLESIQ